MTEKEILTMKLVKHTDIRLLLLLLLTLSWVGCSEPAANQPKGTIETTEEGSQTIVLKGYIAASEGFSVFQLSSFNTPLYIKERNFTGTDYRFYPATGQSELHAGSPANRLDQMTAHPAGDDAHAWNPDIRIDEGSCFWVCYSGPLTYTFIKMRVAYIDGNDVGVEYKVAESAERPIGANDNANAGTGAQTLLETPKLLTTNVFVAHTLTNPDGKEVVNFSLEWDNTKKHSRWVAFSFDSWTAQDKVGRSDAWALDPLLPANMQTSNDDHKNDGFARGHLVASEDRVYTQLANEQTFYYSNMSPQLNAFNGGIWMSLEGLVRDWGRSGVYRTLHVTKGGTLDKLQPNLKGDADQSGQSSTAEGYTIHGVAVPKYYFMAVLGETLTGSYQAIAFILEHKPQGTVGKDVLKTLPVSVSELQTQTGIDFFCNLPDGTESEVEQAFNLTDWRW
jgi:endonuclease G